MLSGSDSHCAVSASFPLSTSLRITHFQLVSNAGAIITFPRETGYDITVEDISDGEATFSFKKHGEVRN